VISFDIKPKASESPLNVSSKDEKGEAVTSFASLLKGLGAKDDDKIVQNGALVLSLKDASEDTKTLKSSKAETLLSLLNGSDNKASEDVSVGINLKVSSTLPVEDLKVIIKEAKEYLKSKIIASDGFKSAEIAKLPKTLKGLAQVAQKLGIDVSKITLQDVQIESKTNSFTFKDDLQPTKVSKNKSTDIQSDDGIVLDTKESIAKNLKEINKDERIQQQVKSDTKTLPRELQNVSLFKTQSKVELSTQQIVHAKSTNITNIESKKQKKQVNDTLQLLLQGEKALKKEGSNLTADFSVSTAKVIAPSAKKESLKGLEALLNGNQKDDTKSSKTDGLSVSKADSFEVKLNEAKQMVKYLSHDVKTAIENYKAPFTRVKIQLNPQRLGEVDMTIVQRGKNLHINLSSNNSAINTLAMNANDLKVQLNNNGINNASLNFNNNSQNGEQANGGQHQQQQHHQNEQKASQEYAYYNDEESNEKIVSSLEIIVPNYA
jgi:flagellar hook-length control protein FliK